jgi:hypothetical protein
MSDLVYQNYNSKCRGWVNPANIPFGPQISGLSGYQSPSGFNTLVAVSGNYFFSYSSISFGTYYPTVYFVNSNLLEFYIPNSMSSGTYPVQVFNGSVGSNIVNYTIDNTSGFWELNSNGTISNTNKNYTSNPATGGGLNVQGIISQTLYATGCTSVGTNSLPIYSTGKNNTCIGYNAGSNITTGQNNTCIGYNAGSNITTGQNNTCIGYNAELVNGTDSNQIILGTRTETVTIPGHCKASSFTTTSDYRIKDVLENITIDKEEYTVDQLKPIKYFNKNTNQIEIGFLAHELQEQFPYLVMGEKDGETNQSLNYNSLIGILVKEIQSLKREIQLLKEK